MYRLNISSSSFPRDYSYSLYEDDDRTNSSPDEDNEKPRILLMGLRRSGKSSIQKVVFGKMSPNETLFLESTNKIVKSDIENNSFIKFQCWDFPGQIDFFFDPSFDSEIIFKRCNALVFVIDAHDDYIEALAKLNKTVLKAYEVNKSIKFEVFIHKVDGINDDLKLETQRDIHQRATDDLADASFECICLNFHLTSIYDYSIFEAFSKVIQKLVPQLPKLENLLNIFIVNSGVEKAFLFDVGSKIYVATDSSPVDMQSFELCCDLIDVVTDLSTIYSADLNTPIDEQSGSVIKLNNGIILYLREIDKFLALVCILRDYNYTRQGVVEYNFLCLHDAIHQIFSVGLSKKVENYHNELNDDYFEQQTNGSLISTKQSSTTLRAHSNSPLTQYLINNKLKKINN
ncbi:ras-related GTP-binding protein C-like isoform X2 [Contarinia nasturtii]|nr:ras-related GTP-binding protein C-like isoform X2 [Contarinia nasturtii]